MQRESVDSSTIDSIGYDEQTSTLEVSFKNGRVYQYFDVPSTVWEEFRTSSSKGQFLNTHIKGRFRYARV
jgi:KTSC domain